jgi:hypothetical protein
VDGARVLHIKGVLIMIKLPKALLETYNLVLEPGDIVRLEQNYSEPTIVDIVITNQVTGDEITFVCFDIAEGIFPWSL